MKSNEEAQSEAPSVDGLTDILDSFHNRMLQAQPFDNDPTKEESSLIEGIWDETEAKINRLIVEAYNKGYSDGMLVKPKYKVGDIAGTYQINERFRRVGKNTKYKVVCILCGAPMFRYSNKFNLKHKGCGAIKND